MSARYRCRQCGCKPDALLRWQGSHDHALGWYCRACHPSPGHATGYWYARPAPVRRFGAVTALALALAVGCGSPTAPACDATVAKLIEQVAPEADEATIERLSGCRP